MTNRRARVIEIASVTPVVAWYAFGLIASVPALKAHLSTVWDGPATVSEVARLIADLNTVLFVSLMVLLFLLRRSAQAKASGVLPRSVALLGTLIPSTSLFLPRVTLPEGLEIASALLAVTGTAGTVFVLAWLGRSFSVFPQARGLVTSGPYRFVRHPLYLAEAIGTVGFMAQFIQPWSALLLLTQYGCQLVRMNYEERLLVDAYPAYAAYRAHTARLIWGLY